MEPEAKPATSDGLIRGLCVAAAITLILFAAMILWWSRANLDPVTVVDEKSAVETDPERPLLLGEFEVCDRTRWHVEGHANRQLLYAMHEYDGKDGEPITLEEIWDLAITITGIRQAVNRDIDRQFVVGDDLEHEMAKFLEVVIAQRRIDEDALMATYFQDWPGMKEFRSRPGREDRLEKADNATRDWVAWRHNQLDLTTKRKH